MKWTTEIPTEPGWYWAKNPQGLFILELVWYRRDNSKGVLVVRDDMGETDYLHEYDVQAWAGPIPEPTE